MLTAVKHGGFALKFAAEDLKGDREIVLAAVSQFGNAIDFVAESLRRDSEVREHTISDAPRLNTTVSASDSLFLLCTCLQVIQAAVQQNEQARKCDKWGPITT